MSEDSILGEPIRWRFWPQEIFNHEAISTSLVAGVKL